MDQVVASALALAHKLTAPQPTAAEAALSL
jgi:hypothetical protein